MLQRLQSGVPLSTRLRCEPARRQATVTFTASYDKQPPGKKKPFIWTYLTAAVFGLVGILNLANGAIHHKPIAYIAGGMQETSAGLLLTAAERKRRRQNREAKEADDRANIERLRQEERERRLEETLGRHGAERIRDLGRRMKRTETLFKPADYKRKPPV